MTTFRTARLSDPFGSGRFDSARGFAVRDMQIRPIDRDTHEVAPTTNAAFTAGFVHKASVFCPACASDKTVSVNGDEMDMGDAAEVTGDGRHVVDLVQTSAEVGAPGMPCDECGRLLDTHVIHGGD